MAKLDEAIEQVKRGLQNPVSEHKLNRKEMNDMAAKKTKATEDAKTKGKAKAKGKAAAKDEDDENKVTLSVLAEEAGISAAAARRKLRAAELENPGRWSWDSGSKGEKAARAALGLDA